MKKIICITILFSIFCGNVFSQNGRKLTESEKQAFEQKMVEQSQKIKTLQCDFVQEKTSALVSEKAVAKGILLYQSPSMLRWEYTAPTPSTLILNGNNAALLNKDGKRVGNDKMIKQLGGLIISVINGDGIKNSKQFSTEVFETDSQFRVVLSPVQKRLKEFYQSIELKIDKNTFLASEIILNEKSGDKTVIYLNNRKLNEKIDKEKFEIKSGQTHENIYSE
ncbi:MAG: outer membrane lipoprotein carrier protein LolA [Bacteroidales bacterium]|jgi:outer membrane lipoprotein-sorting protein|nr:outer membrane lipoprotein carrier protein LolA [Bacteroidales bacterium]